VSATLSRRYGGVAYAPTFRVLSLDERIELHRLTVRPTVEFEDPPERYQCLILEAEAYYARRAGQAGAAEPDHSALTPALSER
jgi:hypothetical protein